MANASTAGGPQTFDARALVRAAGEGDAAGVESLLAAGADVDAALESGETALIRAASKGRLEVVRLLLAVGADANVEREDGFTALSVAVFFGYADIVRALLAGGADPSAKGRLGANVEKWAQLSGQGEVAELLKGAPPKSEAGAHALFPAEGKFSPVVPLSELDGSSPSGSARGAEYSDEAAGRGLKEQEVATLVPARARASRTARPEVPRQGWPLTLLLLGVSLFAGVLAGTYLVRSKWAASQPASSSAEEAAAAVENETPAPTAASVDSRPAPAEARLPEPSAPAAPPESAPRAAVETAATSEAKTEAASKTEKVSDAKPPTRATPSAASENQRAARPETPPRNEAPATARAARRSTPAAAENDRRAQSTGARLITATPRAAAPPPVFSPSPANKSEKRKVIPWP